MPTGQEIGKGFAWFMWACSVLRAHRTVETVRVVTSTPEPWEEQRGAADDRDLWPEVLRVLALTRSPWAVFENVAGIIGMAIDQMLTDLADRGYTARPINVRACGVGRNHRRRRVVIVAYAERYEQPREEPCSWPIGRVGRQQQPVPEDAPWRSALRTFRGMDDGTSYGVDRTDSIRNSVVPQIFEEIGRAILQSSR